jgi:hypothetical protein
LEAGEQVIKSGFLEAQSAKSLAQKKTTPFLRRLIASKRAPGALEVCRDADANDWRLLLQVLRRVLAVRYKLWGDKYAAGDSKLNHGSPPNANWTFKALAPGIIGAFGYADDHR